MMNDILKMNEYVILPQLRIHWTRSWAFFIFPAFCCLFAAAVEFVVWLAALF